MSNDLRGVLTALSTPFKQDETLDVETLRRIVDRSIDAGVDGVVAAGSTGEVGALSSEERLLLSGVVDFTAWPEDKEGAAPVVWLAPALCPASRPSACTTRSDSPSR